MTTPLTRDHMRASFAENVDGLDRATHFTAADHGIGLARGLMCVSLALLEVADAIDNGRAAGDAAAEGSESS